MELNKIQSSGSWGKAADDLNQNFSKVNNAVEQVKNATTRNKGYFSSDTELKSAFHSANVGDIAYIGNAYPYQTWAWDGSAWKKKNDAGGEESVNLGDYYTKEETNEKLAETDEKLSELGSYVENPEYARAYTDAEGRFLWGIKKDGSIEWAKGVPQPIKDYIALVDLENDEEVERINQLVIGLLADVKVLTDTYHYISNPEWVCAIVDAEERILMGIKADGSYYIPNREMYHVESNPEFAKAVVDADGRVLFGIRTDGSCYIPKGASEEARKGLIELTSRIGYFENIFSNVNNPEWLQVTTDAEGKVLEGISADGKKFLPKQELFEKFNDIEGRTEMTLDDEGRIISYRKKDGTKVEVKSEQHHLTIKESLEIKGGALSDFKQLVKSSTETYSPKDFNVPKYGYINIKSEVIFVDAEGNEYTPNNIEKANGQYVVKSNNSIIVNESEKPIDISTWAPNKDKHYCKIAYKWEDVDSESYAIVSFQGSSTLSLPKKNLRAVFYVDNLFSKKYKFKIGEMVETSKYNAKAFYADATRLRDITLQRLIVEARNLRDYSEQYPWNNDYPIYTGAVGTIVSFPIRIDVSGEFYGVFMFGLAKDDKNFMLDGDNTGMLISGDFHNDYPLSFAEFHGETWADEMNDDEELTEHGHTPSNYAALTSLWEWINNGVWDRATVPQHLSVPDFIDYYIFVQVFRMRDNDIHNIILYTKEDKKKFYAFLYDLDLSWGRGYNYDMPINEQRLILWKRFVGVYWQDIVARYWELRSTILNYSHVIGIVNKLQSSIPFSDFENEMDKWDSINYTDATKTMIDSFVDLLVHFDIFFSV